MKNVMTTGAFYVEVYYSGYRRIIEFVGTGSDVFARTLVPFSDAPPEQVIASGDYEESVDLSSCGDPHSAFAMQVVTDDIRDDVDWQDYWAARGNVCRPPEPHDDATSYERGLTAGGSQ